MIKKGNRRIIRAGILAAAVWCIFCGSGLAAQTVTVAGDGMALSDAAVLTLSDLVPQEQTLETLDPNFSEDGVKRYKGIRLSGLLKAAGFHNRKGVTVVGADQYVGYLTPERMAQGMLVWEMDGQPISGLKGGPLKIMFPKGSGMHPSCFTWYVAALVQGRPAGASLTVTVNGKKQIFGLSDLVAVSDPLPIPLLSIAQGCRNEFPERTSDKPARAVRLSRLTGSLPKMASVDLVPYFGPVIHLSAKALSFDAHVIVSCGNESLHPALGGPFSIVFPVEHHHELRELVPESGAFFFLKAIVVTSVVR